TAVGDNDVAIIGPLVDSSLVAVVRIVHVLEHPVPDAADLLFRATRHQIPHVAAAVIGVICQACVILRTRAHGMALRAERMIWKTSPADRSAAIFDRSACPKLTGSSRSVSGLRGKAMPA